MLMEIGLVITSACGILTRKRQAGNGWGIGNVYSLIWAVVTWVYIHMKKFVELNT